MKKLGMADLIHPLALDTFMTRYWQKKPYIGHGSPQRFAEIAAIPELASIDALLEAWRGDADAWAPRDTKHPLINATAKQLPAFYESGYTLYLSKVEDHVPALEPIARKLERDLGLREEDVYFEAFISQGTGSGFHFDPNVTINIQLIGSKQWCVAENKHLVNPHVGWSSGTTVNEHMQRYARQPFPTRMPPGCKRFEARPGTLVYLHPGYWHCTLNHEPSLSLLFTINPPSWTDLLMDEIKDLMLKHDAGRELAFGLGSTAGHEQKLERLQHLIDAAGEAVAQLSATALLADWGGALTASFERNPQVEFRIDDGVGGNDDVLVVKAGRKQKRSLLTQDAWQVLKWIGARKKSFHGHQVAAAIGTVPTARVAEILGEFVETGLILRNGSL
ncbi:MAG: cupin domain-containing protein [Collimonas sp.]|uniref:JmjC domain-containing protein n=1 Tax=Collimonas sp. TaxID=1963772 RepID=UPI003265CB5E